MFEIFPNLEAVMKTTPARWQSLVEAFPAAMLRRRPARGEWSALECLQHLIDLERTAFPQRVRALLAGENFPAICPDTDGTPLAEDCDPATLAAEFAALRHTNLKLVAKLTASDLDCKAIHAELGPVTLGHLLHEWGGHDLMHLVQAERALMQPFIAGCGPWQVYFSDHVVSHQ